MLFFLSQWIFQGENQGQKSRWLPEVARETADRRGLAWLPRLDHSSRRHWTRDGRECSARWQSKNFKWHGLNRSTGRWQWTASRVVADAKETWRWSNESEIATRLSKSRKVSGILLAHHCARLSQHLCIGHRIPWTTHMVRHFSRSVHTAPKYLIPLYKSWVSKVEKRLCYSKLFGIILSLIKRKIGYIFPFFSWFFLLLFFHSPSQRQPTYSL